ncbi:phospholipase A [Capnocytophaga sputigena]|uniref:phospholipase A n=1 Tax=Capnocytophaga sputigena TaxID=1019 RepID=UPI003904C699
MKHSLFILFLAASPFIFSQDTIKDSLQELPKPEQKAYRKAQLERTLSKIWELDREDQRGTFKLVEYLPMYVMPFRFTDKPTEQPISLNPDRPIPEWRDYQHIETKFQVSLKAKIMQDAFGKGDVWVAFTQQSYWQMYNGELSRPFRELNYEPELIFTYPLNFSAGNLKMKMIGLSVNHQSNGKEVAHSRSWNRFILMGVFQWNEVLINARLWKRFTEKSREDDNPDIENYIGRCELSIAYPFRKNVFNLRVRNNLNFNHNRGLVELNWIYPLSRDLRILLQASHGYGDSLIDYNYKQTVIGIGFTFLSL